MLKTAWAQAEEGNLRRRHRRRREGGTCSHHLEIAGAVLFEPRHGHVADALVDDGKLHLRRVSRTADEPLTALVSV
jgi:hypothetical protein